MYLSNLSEDALNRFIKGLPDSEIKTAVQNFINKDDFDALPLMEAALMLSIAEAEYITAWGKQIHKVFTDRDQLIISRLKLVKPEFEPKVLFNHIHLTLKVLEDENRS